ncbi:MAG TPA: Ig-like domain-containing protein, partial [Pyrinomonadaceae bacterium]|nr:Ig-like domain-containing protein [Pyrinomonadaceae bacterium]
MIAVQAYGSGASGAPPAPSDQSLTRTPDTEVGSVGGNFVAHTSAANAAARVFSPGTRTDGTPFGSPSLTRIEVAPASAQLDISAQQSFTARAFALTNGAETEVPSVSFIWDASDATKATLNPATGASTTATTLAAGTTSVRAQAGGQQATATLKINPPPPVLTKVVLMPTTAAIITGQTQQFTARALDQFNQPFTGASYSFNSDDPNIAQIISTTNNADGSADATVSGRGVGTAQITATATSGMTVVLSDAAALTVNPPPPIVTQIVVSPASATINRGQTQQFTAQAFDQNGQPLANVSFTWTTSDTLVATINADGLAHGGGIGAVNLSATAADGAGGTVSGQATLNVRAPLVINEILADVPP